ncbi:MAG: glycosyl hydrolase [Flavobacteriales bacterium]|nr:glycosyl hydrolase [Flavobacteriales bacterium]
MKKLAITLLAITFVLNVSAQKKKEEPKSRYNSGLFSTLKFRSVGPAFTAGRIADIAVNPNNHSEYYLAVASGGVWKTSNAGTTYNPIFDGQGSYSIGCVTIDPNNTNVIWVGSGENNNQRSVAYGDGVYKSLDGGKTWKNMGLKKSEHIGKIIVHPTNSDIVYVAAYGPLWSEGGDRGVYKTTNGGETWERILHISDHTGIAEIAIDPRDPNVIYASAHQRRRHVFTYIGGGPESGLHKTTDGGKTWKKINSGLPKVDIGRIGLAISPADPDVVYAIVEASQDEGGFYKSSNRGESWEKQSKYNTSGNYYQEIYCHPTNVDIVYAMDTWFHHTEDGGKTFKQTGEKSKHVDNHCMWIDPNDTEHWLVGCDGGLYETWDAASNWQYKPNLPITQYYKVATDNAFPFYNIYGGTQDNNSQGGPSRTTNNAGIVNSDWYITNGGDGFESQIDPKDPNIVYAQSQYGWLVRYDKQSGEQVGIKPFPKKGEPALRFNWDAPLLISPHNHKRLYFAAQKLFKSDDRGDTWTAISGDLTRQLDRNKMQVMGKVWSIDAVMKNKSTTIYGNIVALDESPKKEGLLYVGTDDGLIQVSENDGQTWKKYIAFPGIPEMTYVNMLKASKHDENTVFAVFNNHKRGDFKPYVLRSKDKGKSWANIAGNLPSDQAVYCIEQDHVNPNILFVGTEYGVFVTLNGGKHWIQLKSGLPTIAVRDMEIQQRENDLVLASFGRSFYVLDNYAPLRELADESLLDKRFHIFDVKKSLMFNESNPLGYKGKNAQGESFYTAENPPVGSVIRYYFSDTLKTAQEIRREKEKKSDDDFYPNKEEIRKEATEEKAFLLFVIKDENGEEIQRIKTDAKAGLNEVVWNFRYETTTPIKLKTKTPGRYESEDVGQMALPGTYTVTAFLANNGQAEKLGEPKSFEIELLNHQTLVAQDKAAALAFHKEISELRRSVRGTSNQLGEINNRIKFIKQAVENYINVDMSLMARVKELEKTSYDAAMALWGDNDIAKHEFETYPSIMDRIEIAVWDVWNTTAAPPNTAKSNIKIAQEEYPPVQEAIKKLLIDVESIEKQLTNAKVPYTPGRGEEWKEE